MNESRQVRRAKERHDAKVAAATAAGRKYPGSWYLPAISPGKFYAANGKRECARRLIAMESA